MSEDDPLLRKADQLMHRHRVFVAGSPQPPVEPPPAKAVATDDVPLLTEVVDAAVPPAPTFSPAPSEADIEALLRERLAALLPAQREALRRELASWLDEQLPQLVMRVFDGVTDQLVAQVATQARVALLPRLQAVLEAEPPAVD